MSETNTNNKPVKIGDYVEITNSSVKEFINQKGSVTDFDGTADEYYFNMLDTNRRFLKISPENFEWKILQEADERNSKIFDIAVYTIIHSSKIDAMINGTQEKVITEPHKSWRSAKNYFETAKSINKDMFCILAPAENTTFLYAYGKIESIEIDEDTKNTTCKFSEIYRFPRDKVSKSELIMLNGEYIPSNYIRTYILCLAFTVIKYLVETPQKVRAKLIKKTEKPEKKEINTTTFNRDCEVKDYALRRARGICEACEKPAPFKTKKGEPYLEVHHLIPLGKGGFDTIDNVIAVCPNCHRKLHFGIDSEKETEKLAKKINIK